MLTTETLRLYDLVFKLATKTQCLPLHWDNSRSVIKLTPPPTRKWRVLAYLVTALDLLAMLFLTCGYIDYSRLYQNPSRNIIPIVGAIGLWFATLFASTGFTATLEIVCLTNKILQTNKDMSSYFGTAKKYDGKLYQISKQYLLCCATFICCMFLYYMRPNAHDNLYVFYGGSSIIGKFVYAALAATILARKFMVVIFFVFIMFGCGYLLRVWLNLMMEYVEAGHMTAEEALTMYNSVRINQRLFQNCIGPGVLPGMLFMGVSVLVVDVSGLIMFHGEMSPIVIVALLDMAGALVVAIVFGFRLLRASNRCSKAFVKLMEVKARCDKYNSLRIKACRLIQIRIGTFFVAKDITILTIFVLVADSINSLVIAYRE